MATTMEDLTKTQIVLLTLLISFVTSIATGIITTSLLAEAPASVTQTINRVVEHTIEKVAPEMPASTGSTVKEVTIVKEEDAIIDSLDRTTASVVRVRQTRPSGADDSFYSLGVIVSTDGLVVADKRPMLDRAVFKIVMSDGTVRRAELIKIAEESNLSLFRILPEPTIVDAFKPITLSKKDLRLGQSVIAIEGIEKNIVAVGRVLGVNTGTETLANGSSLTTVYSVDTDIKENEISGSPLINLSGELVGIKTSMDDLSVPEGAYTTLASIRRLIESR